MIPVPQKVVDRLLSKYEIDERGCWISLYSTGSHGYSQIGWWHEGKSQVRLGHRLSWEVHRGEIPDDMTVDHVCRVRKCINPDHLRLLSNVDNAQEGGGVHEGRPVESGKLCGKGLHSLMVYPTGAVACRECANERSQRKYPGRVVSRLSRGVSL